MANNLYHIKYFLDTSFREVKSKQHDDNQLPSCHGSGPEFFTDRQTKRTIKAPNQSLKIGTGINYIPILTDIMSMAYMLFIYIFINLVFTFI